MHNENLYSMCKQFLFLEWHTNVVSFALSKYLQAVPSKIVWKNFINFINSFFILDHLNNSECIVT